MMPRSVSYHEKLIQDLKDPLEAAAYIEVALEENEPDILSKALENVIEARGGIEHLPLRAKQAYEKLDTNLKEDGQVEYYALNTLLKELGLYLSVAVTTI